MAVLESSGRLRPVGVWVIVGWTALSVAWSLLGYFLIYTGKAQLTPEMREYLSSLSLLERLASLAVGVANVFGVVLLWRLRRRAVFWLTLALYGNVAMTVYQTLTTHVIAALDPPRAIGTLFGWALLIGIILYARRLSARGILT